MLYLLSEMSIKNQIPNALTCCNLLCGCLAIVQAFNGNLGWSAYLVGIAVVFDFLDGLAARALHASSPIGKDLDSLADMVSFGVVPGVVMYKLLWQAKLIYDSKELLSPPDTTALSYENNMISYCYVAFIITIFSAIRLAKFNNDSRQLDSFIGLPTPANAIFVCSLPLVLAFQHKFIIPFFNPYFLLTVTCLLSLLLIAPLPLFALKFKHFNWKENEVRYIFLILAALLLSVLKFVGIPLTIILYILLSIINNLLKNRAAA